MEGEWLMAGGAPPLSLMEPNPPLQTRTNGFYPDAALDSKPSLGSPDRALGAGRTGVVG